MARALSYVSMLQHYRQCMGSLPERRDMQGRKLSLADAFDGDAAALLIYCMNHAVGFGGCFHSGTLPRERALELWPGSLRLDELPLRCSRCGSRKVDVRTTGQIAKPREGPSFDELLNRWRDKHAKSDREE
jgi:hypothetical protein